MVSQTALDIYYVFAAVSTLCSIGVIVSILKVGFDTSPSKLVLCLHLTMLVENLTSIPDLYCMNNGLCSFLGFLRTYFGVSNALVLLMIVLHYRFIFIIDQFNIKDFISMHREKIIFFTPIFTILPFSTNSYGATRGIWCSVKSDNISDDIWSFAIYYIWIMAIVCFSALTMLDTIFQVYLADKSLAQSLVKSTGMYAVVLILSWLPRILARFNVISYINGNIFLYFSGIAYGIIYISERNSLSLFEENARATLAADSDRGSIYMSWHFDSLMLASKSVSEDADSVGKFSSPSIANKSYLSMSISRLSGFLFPHEKKDEKFGRSPNPHSVIGSGHNSANRGEHSAIGSAHSSANRGEHSTIGSAHNSANMAPISPIYGEELPHVTDSSSPIPPPMVVIQNNRPISANLIGLQVEPSLVPPPPPPRPLAGLPPLSSADRQARRNDFINYHGIARYSMNIDDSIRKSSNIKATPENVRSNPLPSSNDHESSRPNSSKVTIEDRGKRPTSNRLAPIGNKLEITSNQNVVNPLQQVKEGENRSQKQSSEGNDLSV
jgi:hypothetical protein